VDASATFVQRIHAHLPAVDPQKSAVSRAAALQVGPRRVLGGGGRAIFLRRFGGNVVVRTPGIDVTAFARGPAVSATAVRGFDTVGPFQRFGSVVLLGHLGLLGSAAFKWCAYHRATRLAPRCATDRSDLRERRRNVSAVARRAVTINGFTYRSTVAVLGGAFMVGVSAENRAGANVVGGDDVDVELELDTEPRVVTELPDFAAALDAEPMARRTFDGISRSDRSWHVLQVEGARLASFGRVERHDLQRRRPADSVASGHRPRCGARLDPTGAGAAGFLPVLSDGIPLGPFE